MSVRLSTAIVRRLVTPVKFDNVLRGMLSYTFAMAVPRAVGILILPLTTRALSPTEYGELATVATISAAVGTVLSLGLETAVFRDVVRLSDRPADRAMYVNSVWTFAITTSVVVALLLGGGLWVVGPAWLSIPWQAFLLAFLGVAIAQSIVSVPLAVLRADERLGTYLRVNVAFAVASGSLLLIAVVVLDLGVIGALGASLLASLAFFAITASVVPFRWTTNINRRLVIQALAFGIPIVPHALSHWALTLSDRLILGTYLDQAQVGVYSLAYQVAALVSLLSVAINQAVMPIYARASRSPGRADALSGTVTFQVLAVAFLGLGAATLGPPVLMALVPSAYWEAASLVPLLVLGAVLFGWYYVPMDSIVLVQGRTRSLFVWTMIAAAANVILNLIFVPRYGATAAAASTAVGYGLLLILMLAYARRRPLQRIQYQLRPIILGTSVMAATFAGVSLLVPLSTDLAALFWRGVAMAPSAAIVLAALPRDLVSDKQTTE
jgi:O-antigen/teichoic acid export membrane protein